MQDIREFEQIVSEWMNGKICEVEENKHDAYHSTQDEFITKVADELNDDLQAMCENWLERHGQNLFDDFVDELEEDEDEDEDEDETQTNNHSANVQKIASLDSRILEAIITILEPHMNQGDRP